MVLLAFAVLPQTPAHTQQLTFATYPFGDADTIYRAFRPTVEYIAAEIGQPVRLVVTRDYQELSDRLVDGTVDIAWIGSANYVKTRRRLPAIQYITTYLERSSATGELQPYYQSVILARSDSRYRSLQDLEGARFGFTSPDSTSGYAYPRMMLAAAGIDPETYFESIFFLGRHSNVISALNAGSLDAGAVSDGTYYNTVVDYPQQFTVLEWSVPIPLDALAAAPHLGRNTVLQVRQALEALPETHPSVQVIQRELGWPAAGFATLSDALYNSVETALEYSEPQ